jgi:hypothetical protein
MEIEKDIPVPEDLFPTVYPFAKMEVGDSVTQAGKAGKKMAQAARMYAARHPEWDCVTRKLDTGATRVWRTA